MARLRPSASTARLRSLSKAVRGPITQDPAHLTPFGHDASHLSGTPLAAVAPADPDDVVELVRWARRTRTPLVARGGGTSLDGESVPADGSVVVDLSGWSQLFEVDPDGSWARVGPGMVNRELARALQPYGRFFPPNPGSWTASTIGGNVSTNASGMRSFRYGATRNWVREVEVVLGTGARVRLGSRAAKRSVGPDLLQMFIGSEGTLGIATEVTVRLAPLPAVRPGVAAPLPEDVRLAPLATRLGRLPGLGLSAVEYLDQPSAAVLAERHVGKLPPDSSLLLLELEAEDADDAERKLERVSDALGPVGGGAEATVFRDADELWTLRGESGDALLQRVGYHVREDVAVPVGEVDHLVAALRAIARREAVPLFLYGHLGEGSLHPNYVVDPTTRKAERIRAAVLHVARALGGTISAEHGIGVLKRPFLADELGVAAVELLNAVKRACDPDGILNPGKLYPPPGRGARRPSRLPSGPAIGRTRSG
ncbi:MAG TPA: FAD-binding oxidoreductase [Thermoplasmata archaeon]|nr:FAD-binding oxidoreductase [Thermoplasmata archaeon]